MASKCYITGGQLLSIALLALAVALFLVTPATGAESLPDAEALDHNLDQVEKGTARWRGA